jgi:hypothetical protein
VAANGDAGHDGREQAFLAQILPKRASDEFVNSVILDAPKGVAPLSDGQITMSERYMKNPFEAPSLPSCGSVEFSVTGDPL